MTNQEALERAKNELGAISYYLECGNLNSGLRKIFENKYDFLRVAISAMEKVEQKNM